MSNEISKPNQYPLSFDEFKKQFLELKKGSLIDEAVDIYETLPGYVKALSNLEPTGIASAIAQILEDHKVQQKEERLLRALYEFAKAIQQHAAEISALKQDLSSEKVYFLTHLYFEYSQRTQHLSKIELFRNIWLNGVLSIRHDFNQEFSAYKVLESLSEDEIKVLIEVYNRQVKEDSDAAAVVVNINDLTAHFGYDETAYIQQIGARLQSLGLFGDIATGSFLSKKPATHFFITDYGKKFVNWILEPDNVNNIGI